MNFRIKLLLFVFIGAFVALATLSGIAVYRMHKLSEASLTIQKNLFLMIMTL